MKEQIRVERFRLDLNQKVQTKSKSKDLGATCYTTGLVEPRLVGREHDDMPFETKEWLYLVNYVSRSYSELSLPLFLILTDALV